MTTQGMNGTDNPITIVIFGASGDLTRRKLIPALFNLWAKGRLPGRVRIVGSARTEMEDAEFCNELLEGMRELAGMDPDEEEWDRFAKDLHYLPGDVTKDQDYRALQDYLEDLESEPANRLYYMAMAPRFFTTIVDKLGVFGMAEEGEGWRRLVVEKPFGHDLKSAQELNQSIHKVFDEHQVYRIDHYLGKDTAQNILYFRFLNTIFEPIWNRNYIDHVQITVAEEVDVGHRADYYDQVGVVRDMFQNHLMQLLTLVAMEPPAMFEADPVRNEKVKLLRAVQPVKGEDTVRAQYEGYCETEGTSPDSQTATYAAIRLNIDNWRWQGVPFYLRSGKALSRKTTEIVVEFNQPPHVMFNLKPDYQLTPNFISLCIQPDEGIHLRFETKVPGEPEETRSVDMEFHYGSSFQGEPLPDAYERLLMDALQGDASLFTRNDEIEMAWRIVDPILEGWEGNPESSPLVAYKKGSLGPREAAAMLAKGNRVWRMGCGKHEGGD